MEILGITVWGIFKVFILIFLSLYVIFSLVVVRQIDLMIKTIKVGLEGNIKLIGYLHFLFAVGVLIFAIISL